MAPGSCSGRGMKLVPCRPCRIRLARSMASRATLAWRFSSSVGVCEMFSMVYS